MNGKADQLAYHVYVLRSWREGDAPAGTPGVWRYSLEDPVTRQRRGFADLASLTRYLLAEAEMGACPHIDQVDDQA
ncbi:MAG: hypothetical protein JXC32_07630 [Anaerolineae bacterium]|nr:hypothetical protein [Anaerolineae bacterium]